MSKVDSDGYIQMGGGKEYRLVAHRVSDFRQMNPDWLIDTKYQEIGQRHYMSAKIMKPCGDEGMMTPVATAHKEIKFEGGKGAAAQFPLETAETGAIGRALALCGFGTLDGALDEGDQIADSPVSGATKKKGKG